jgi:glycosyltransferase involved in cell wall biosynthesis
VNTAMLVSCICVCHNKPDLTHEAIQSILDQCYPHWEAIVVDSGVLYDGGYYDQFRWRRDPRIKLIRSDETDETRRTKAMAPWCYNQCFRKGLVSGDLVMYLCDDDLLYPNAFATFVSYCRQNPDAVAMYAGQDLVVIHANGWRAIVGERRATRPGGRSCNGRQMDCYVDYLQLCHKTEILERFPDQEYWPETKDYETHADGIFMERIGEHAPIYPIDAKVSQNRRTLHSTYVPVGSFSLVECMANGIPLSRASGGPLCPPASRTSGINPAARQASSDPLVTISIACGNQHACLAETLASVTAQTYANLEVLVIDDCLSDRGSASVGNDPRFRLLPPNHAGSRTTRDRGLWEARGVYFIAMDAGTLACPEMVERFVAAMRRNPKLSALTCYLGAFRATGGDELLASTKNIYSGGIFYTARLRAVGGFGSNLDWGGQDWVGFLNLVNRGHQVDIIPEHVFYYWESAHGKAGGERSLRSFIQLDRQLAAERVGHWAAFAAMQRRQEELAEQNRTLREQNQALKIRCEALRYQVADRLTALCARVPFAKRSIHWLLRRIGTGPRYNERRTSSLLFLGSVHGKNSGTHQDQRKIVLDPF